MPMSAKGSLLTERLISLLTDNAAELGLEAIYYGDQEYVPKVPAACVEPAQVSRQLQEVTLRTDNTFTISVILYYADIQGTQDAQRGADMFAEKIIDVINTDGITERWGGTQFGGLVLYGYVSDTEYGYIVKQNKLLRANRLLVTGKSLTNLLEA